MVDLGVLCLRMILDTFNTAYHIVARCFWNLYYLRLSQNWINTFEFRSKPNKPLQKYTSLNRIEHVSLNIRKCTFEYVRPTKIRFSLHIHADWFDVFLSACAQVCFLTLQLMFMVIIKKTYLYNFDPLKPHFCIVKLGLTGVYIIFLISAKNIDCGYSLEPPRRGGSKGYPQSIFWAEIWKISEFYICKFSFFGCKIFNISE